MSQIYSQESTEGDDGVPSYMIAADNHNTGNLNPSIFSDSTEAGAVKNFGRFIASSALSGINSFYNTAVWAGNLFSKDEAQYRDTKDWISRFDDDLGEYYGEHRQAADLVGFVASSFVPGLGGVKVFNAGVKALTAAKEGTVGVNMARGLGVLPGQRESLVKAAISSFDTTRTAFSMSNPATLKAIAAGFGEQTLQALAFETAVVATMHQSPILSDMDVGDLVSNIAIGGALGGAIGGVIEGAVTLSKVKAGIKLNDKKLIGVTQDLRGVAGTSASDELLIIRNDMDTLPVNAPEGIDPDHYSHLWEKKLERMDNNSRQQWSKLTGDEQLGNMLYEALRTDPTGSYSAKVLGLEKVAIQADSGVINKRYKLDAEDTPYAVRHLKLWGDDMGKLSDEAPGALHLADRTKDGVEVLPTRVRAGQYDFKIEFNKAWSPATASYEEALARNIWAMDDTVPKLSLRKDELFRQIGVDDFPMLTKAYREGFKDFQLLTPEGDLLPAPRDLLGYIQNRKDTLMAEEFMGAGLKGKDLTAEFVANKYDVTLGYLTGEQYSADVSQAIFGLASAQKSFYNKFHANTVNPPALESVKPWLKQQNFKMVYDTRKVESLDNFQVEAMALIRQRQVIQQKANDNAVASVLKNDAGLLPEFSDALLARASRTGAGPGFFSFANGNYGSLGSLAEHVGSLTTNWVRRAGEQVAETFTSANYAVVNDSKATASLAAVLQKVRAAGSSHTYVMSDEGGELILKKVRDYERAVAAGDETALMPEIPQGIDERIPLNMPAVENWVRTHIEVNGTRVQGFNNLRGAQGLPAGLDKEIFYPPQPNPDRFKFHAFVVDDTRITSTGHTTMLYADSAQALEQQIAEARRQGFNAYTPDQTANYYKARGMYDYSKGLNENQIDSALRRSGSSAPAFPLTGSPTEMIQDIMQWHAKEEGKLIREAVITKYSRQFGTLRQQGEEYASVANATMGWKARFAGEAENPYKDYINTFLGASLKGDYPLWTAMNNFVDTVGSKVYNTVTNLWKPSVSERGMASPKKLADGQYDWEKVNKAFDEYGVRMAATDAQMEAWVNHPAGQGVVTKFIQQQNAILSSLVLRLDPVNALNNAIGSVVLTGAETASVMRAIRSGNAEAVGKLAEMGSVALPGTGDLIRSPAKLIAGSYRAFFSEGSKELIEQYKRKGFITDLSGQFKELLEHATLSGTETAAQLESKMHKMKELFAKVGDFGEKWTGNKVAEEMNRFVAANIMDRLTGEARRLGLMDEATADTYINTFVNRTQGNMIASQRPQMFQGPVGQAIGLFQTYQFNIMQQLLRYVGEGSRKDALTLLGLQTTIYGMNGLPGFQAINQHIIGTASGNKNHTDAYSSTYNALGKQAGDWVTYGVASNMLLDPDLKINLYSRGDINPRTVTVVPSNMADIPIVASWAKLATSLKSSVSSIANGGDVWGSILSGIEHNGISRPLAGLARAARGIDGDASYSTSGKGNIVSANDLFSLANLARISGAKPFDEAVMQDSVYRIQAYQAVDRERRERLGLAVKSTIASGETPSQEQMQEFMSSYVKIGGKQEEFTKWYVQQLRTATTSQANKIIEGNKTQYSEYLQTVMGGRMAYVPPAPSTPSQEQ